MEIIKQSWVSTSAAQKKQWNLRNKKSETHPTEFKFIYCSCKIVGGERVNSHTSKGLIIEIPLG
jgi:hypothetical protein